MVAEHAVFAYGSLNHPAAAWAQLAGWRRSWTVCTDNTDLSRAVAYYRPGTLERFDGQILFLGIDRAPGSTVRGRLLPVSPDELAELDAREGNYERVDVTAGLDLPHGRTTVWSYVGKASAVRAARRGLARGTAVVWRAYLDRLRELSVDEPLPPHVPVVDLDRRLHGERTDPYGNA
ncbi:gamma-glutamylcyclotransferase [Asanoa sp. WMMD1127]|uniref:gamma-glutamylcyclotransferase family protein n=1 Tax=Asanoa sp. WMMD1127 TaxID=3016107 RepID=UPI002416FBBA|nr:gamma-glutamylcyclotransferase family protein [Asanoa sp. WMMD1127]MDG4827332.1 gamma-glutamylcyclotransferase [Asanoa sp. WMMD1127]